MELPNAIYGEDDAEMKKFYQGIAAVESEIYFCLVKRDFGAVCTNLRALMKYWANR